MLASAPNRPASTSRIAIRPPQCQEAAWRCHCAWPQVSLARRHLGLRPGTSVPRLGGGRAFRIALLGAQRLGVDRTQPELPRPRAAVPAPRALDTEAKWHYARLSLLAKPAAFLKPLSARTVQRGGGGRGYQVRRTARRQRPPALRRCRWMTRIPRSPGLRAKLGHRIGEVQFNEVILAVDALVRFSAGSCEDVSRTWPTNR
jgi:hypothetical protein